MTQIVALRCLGMILLRFLLQSIYLFGRRQREGFNACVYLRFESRDDDLSEAAGSVELNVMLDNRTNRIATVLIPFIG